MKRLIAYSLLLFALADPAYAGTNQFYLSAQAGLGSMQTPKLANSDTYDLGDYAWRLSGGYLYKIGDMEYGVELGHDAFQANNYGKTPVVTRFRGFTNDLLAVIRYAFYQNWSIFTEFGASQFHMTTESTATNPDVQHLIKILPELAFGFGYGFTDHLSLNISFDYEFGSKPKMNENTFKVTKNSVPTSSSILAGFTYTF